MEDSKVAVLIEDLLAKFQVFGEGLDALRVEVRQNAEENRKEHEQNRREHQQMMQMFEQNSKEHKQMMQSIQELNNFQIELKRVK